MFKKLFWVALTLCGFLTHPQHAQAQPMWTIDLLGNEKKPEKFEDRKLGSEKLAEKKFTLPRRVFQNNFTHYNYYFNANNKINTVIARAKEAAQEDYTKLLPYYPFSLENTASQKTELDSVIYKATAGILLHDLRNDWIDNMYLLMGKAYFLRKDFDSAAATFQFINYNLFPRKKNEDDSRVVGTMEEGSSAMSIANPEKRNILQKITAQPPSRNDALIWLARTLIEQQEYGDASALINTLQHDPKLPPRLQNDLADVSAYWFYKQGIYDSSARYLEAAVSVGDTKQDRSRTEYLLAQLYEMSGQYDKADEYYGKASSHTTNRMIDIYAQLNSAKMRRGSNPKELDNGIANLVKLSRKDNFDSYRDILFYAAGEMAMMKPDTNQAVSLFTKSFQNNENNVVYRNKAFLQLAEIAYERRKYADAYAYYDSLKTDDSTIKDRTEEIQERRNALSKIVEKLDIIHREDSLQRIAAMPEPERSNYIRKLSRQLRKAKGIKEDASFDTGPMMDFAGDKKDQSTDLFAAPKAGEWYFHSSTQKSKGYADFKKKWGNRPNTDNWRRKSAAAMPGVTPMADPSNTAPPSMNPDDVDVADPPKDQPDKKDIAGKKPVNPTGNLKGGNTKLSQPETKKEAGDQNEDFSFEGLMSRLPLSPEQMDESRNKVALAIYGLARVYQEDLEDYEMATDTYDTSLQRFPDSLYDGDLYLGMYYCYSKLGDKAKADYYKNLLENGFPSSRSFNALKNPDLLNPGGKTAEGTRMYEQIYNLFIEGKFDEAIAGKKNADSLYGKNYWTPQLLYIEAVYHVKQKNDSLAIQSLKQIVTLFPDAPLKPRAERLIDVLGRRKEIEDYLTKLQVTRMKEDSVITVQPQRVRMVRNDSTIIRPQKLSDSTRTLSDPIAGKIGLVQDSLINIPKKVSGPYVFNYTASHQVIMILDKVDGTYVNESKNAMSRYVSDYFSGQNLTVARDALDKERSLIVFQPFADAQEALQFLIKVRKAAPDELSWLPAGKYSFMLIDADNLVRMKETKDIPGYKALLKKQFPENF